MKDLTGTRFDFTVAADVAETICVRVSRGGVAEDLAGAAWLAHCWSDGGEVLRLAVVPGANKGELLLSIPSLKGGTYGWELFTQGDAGDVRRALYGDLVSVTTRAADLALDEAEGAVLRTISFDWGAESGAVATVQWLATTAAAKYAADARKWAEGCEGVLEAANDAKDAALEALDKAGDALSKLEHLDAMLAAFQDELNGQIHIDTESGTWIIAGVDSRYPAQGPQGKPGLDGDAVVRIEVAAYEDIPQSGPTCNGKYRYYVKLPTGLWEVYEWVEELSGSARWVKTGEANDIATSELYGLMKYGTDEPSANSVPYVSALAKDEQGRAAFDLSSGGALVNMSGSAWAQEVNVRQGSHGITSASLRPYGRYTGLRTSKQFSQEGGELRLNLATEGLAGGVYLSKHLLDANDDAVFPSKVVVDIFAQKEDVPAKEDVYDKETVYTKAEVETLIQEAVNEVKEWVESGESADYLIPAGTILWAARAAMTGYLLCDGSSVSREEFPRLFAAIGTRFGEGEDSESFRLPDLRGRVTQGADGDFAEYKEAGLPPLKGRVTRAARESLHQSSAYFATGPFYGGITHDENGNTLSRLAWPNGWYLSQDLMFDASRVSPVYRDDCDTVQPPAVALNAFIKI